jgi:hypothetical protein
MWAMLVTTAPCAEKTGFSGVKIAVHAELLHEPALLRGGASSSPPAIAPAWPTARVSLAFQRPTTQATTGLVNSASSS